MKYIILAIFCALGIISKGQVVEKCDSSFIYKHFLFYHEDNNTFDDIDEPFIEEYWETQKENAKKYFLHSAYLKSIPVSQRVIMISYLDDVEKMKAHKWIYSNLQTLSDTVKYFEILNTSYGVSYSKLNISKDVVNKYCSNCDYK